MTLTLTSGLVRGGRHYIAGDAIELPDDEAKRFLSSGLGELPGPEAAFIKPPANAAAAVGKRRTRNQ